MLGSERPVGFIGAADYAAARAFYEGVLGLEFVRQDDYALVVRADGVTVRITRLPDVQPSQHTVFGWEVADVRRTAASLAERGVVFECYDFLAPDQGADGVWTGPGGAQVAWFRDPDGNLLSISTSGC
ncbi:VOC family protein [Phenylobacterium sp. VNQ135]|uniref:VOC family protein n=1 Tax=Phenylobacterium sp. VNQ135 TaxID=3400922 RepID=UPI003C08EC7F